MAKNSTTIDTQTRWFGALPFILGCIAIGFLGSYLGGAFKKQQWYDDSPKPILWPPQWVFPTVWIGNYTFMGLAVWQIWRKRRVSSFITTFNVFMIHLLHNFIFIAAVNRVQKKSFYVLMDFIGLSSGVVTAWLFGRIAKSARLLMLPYICWLCFTTFIKILWWRMK